MNNKNQMIEAIRQQNRTAAPGFLDAFDEEQLQRYLTRLTKLHGHRGRWSQWIRDGPMRSVVTRRKYKLAS